MPPPRPSPPRTPPMPARLHRSPGGAEPVVFRTLGDFAAAASRASREYPPYLPPEHSLSDNVATVSAAGLPTTGVPVAESLPAIATVLRRALTSPMSPSVPLVPDSEGDDAALAAATAAAEEAARRRRLETLLGETDVERGALRADARRANAGADAPTEDMYRQVQELLTLFGVPYVIAPQEAEAQCAWMNAEGLVDAVVTDDSDAFLFGAKHVYRNVFESKKYVEAYAADRIEAELGLDRARMAELALLLGSDYTEGVGGVGIVNALEIVNAFPGLDGLAEFRDWVNIAEFTGAVPRALLASEAKPKRKKRRSELASSVRGKETEDEDAEDAASSDDEDATVLASVSRDADENPASARFKEQHRAVKKGWDLPPAFPSKQVLDAYAKPSVDESRERLEWGRPDLDMLRVFCLENFNWHRAKTDELLLPVLNCGKVGSPEPHRRFFAAAASTGGFNERRQVPLERIQRRAHGEGDRFRVAPRATAGTRAKGDEIGVKATDDTQGKKRSAESEASEQEEAERRQRMRMKARPPPGRERSRRRTRGETNDGREEEFQGWLETRDKRVAARLAILMEAAEWRARQGRGIR